MRGIKLDAVLPMLSVPRRPRLPGTVGWITDFQHRAMPEFFSSQDDLAASKGEKVPAFVDTGVNTITKANMTSERSQQLINPKVK